MAQSSLVDTVADFFDWGHGQAIPDRPVEPEQTYILGGKYADYALAFVFALAFPLLRTVLRTLIFAVSDHHERCSHASHSLYFSANCHHLPQEVKIFVQGRS